MEDENVKVKVWVCTNLVGSKCTAIIPVPKEDWEDMDDKQKDELMMESMFDLIEWDYEVQ